MRKAQETALLKIDGNFTFDTFRRGEEEVILGKYGVDNLNGALRMVSEIQIV